MEYIGKRISVVKKDEEVSIVISSSENKRGAWFMLFWMLCWVICGFFILSLYNSGLKEKEKVFIYVFFAFWLYFLLRVIYALMWKWSGLEIIKIRDGKVFLKRDIRGRGKIHVYENDFIKNPRVRETDYSSIVTAISSADWLANREA